MRKPIVAIDGPAGAGKSSASKALAHRMGYVFINSGAMYRAVALFADRQGIAWDEAERLAALAKTLHFTFTQDEAQKIIVNDEDVTEIIRTPHYSKGSSIVAALPPVVDSLPMRELGKDGGIVMEGRDIATRVFPDAEVKIYLTATPEERTRRRLKELENKGIAVHSFEEELEETIIRDHRDSTRPYSPLKKADDAIEVVTDGMSFDQVVDRLEELVRAKEI